MVSDFFFRGMAGVRSIFGTRLAAVTLLPLLCLMVACNTKSEEERLASAKRLLEERNILGAIIAYQDFIKKYPESPYLLEAQRGLATSYFIERDFANCREVLDSIVQNAGAATNPGLSAMMLKFDTYLQEQRFADALNEAESTSDSLATAQPEMRMAFQLKLAQLYELNKQPENAIPVYKALIEEETPSQHVNLVHLESIIRLKMLYMHEKQEEEALTIFANYLEKHPETELTPRLHSEWGKLLRQLGRNDEAIAQFDKAGAAVEGQIEEAAGADEKTMYMLVLADINQLRGRSDEARTLYRKIIDDFPYGAYRSHAMMQLAESLYQENDVESALSTLEQVIQNYPKSQHAQHAFRRQQEMRFARTSGESPTTDTLTLEAVTEASGLSLDAEAAPAEGAPAQEAPPEEAPSEAPAPGEPQDASSADPQQP